MKIKYAFILALTAMALPMFSTPAQAVETPPPFVDYQGTVFDGEGAPLGATGSDPNYVAAPTNYKMQF